MLLINLAKKSQGFSEVRTLISPKHIQYDLPIEDGVGIIPGIEVEKKIPKN